MGYQTITGSEFIQIHLPSKQREEVKLGVFSIWFGAVAVATTAVIAIAYPAQASHLVLLHLVLGGLTLTSVLFLAARLRDGVWLAAVPLLVNLGTVLLIATVPFATSWQTLSFRWRQASYTAMTVWATEQPAVGQATAENSTAILPLPNSSRHLSMDGNLYVWAQGDTAVYFFPSTQASSHISGYLYTSAATITAPNGLAWQQITPYGRGWYYIVSGR